MHSRGWNTPIDPKKQLIRKIESANRPLSEEQFFETLHEHVTADEKLKARIQEESIEYDYRPFVSLIPEDSEYHTWAKKRKIEDAAKASTKDSHALDSEEKRRKVDVEVVLDSDSSGDDQEANDEDSLEEISSDSEPSGIEKDVEEGSGSELDHSPSLSLGAWIDGDANVDEQGPQQESKAEESNEKAQTMIDLSPLKAKKPKKSSSPGTKKRSKSR